MAAEQHWGLLQRFHNSCCKPLDQNLCWLVLWLFLIRGLFWGIWQLLWWQRVDLPVRDSSKAGECLLDVYSDNLSIYVIIKRTLLLTWETSDYNVFVQWWTAEGAVQQWSHPLKPGLHCSVGDTTGSPGHSSRSTKSDISWFLLSLGGGVWVDIAVISLWTDPWCTLGRCWWSTAGQKRNLGHSAAATAAPWVAGSGSEPHWNPAVWTTRNRKNSTGQSCCYRVFNDLPQVERADSSAVSQWKRSMLMTGCVCVRMSVFQC